MFSLKFLRFAWWFSGTDWSLLWAGFGPQALLFPTQQAVADYLHFFNHFFKEFELL